MPAGHNYDLKMLQIRASRGGEQLRYGLNPAFRPALGVHDSSDEMLGAQSH
jgi:hypothetical protein